MKIQVFPNTKPIEICHFSRNFDVADTLPVRYTDYKLSILLCDGWSVVVGDRIIPITTGDILTFSPPEIHYAKINRSGIFEYLDVYIPEEYFSAFNGEFWQLMSIFSENHSNIIRSPKNKASIIERTKQIIAMLNDDTPQKEIRVFCSVMRLLIFIHTLSQRENIEFRDTDLPRAVSAAMNYIENNYAEPVTLPGIAAEIGCSITYLTRTFRKSTGKSVHAFLTEYRLHKAQQLLAGGTTVTEACYNTGFSDCSGFIKIFKKNVGYTPLEFKRKIQSEHSF